MLSSCVRDIYKVPRVSCIRAFFRCTRSSRRGSIFKPTRESRAISSSFQIFCNEDFSYIFTFLYNSPEFRFSVSEGGSSGLFV